MATPTAADDGFSASQQCPGDRSRFGGRIAAVGYGLVCLHVLCFGILALFEPSAYYAFTREDNWIEYLTVVWYLLAGAMLFAAAGLGRGGRFARGAYLLAGIGLVFAAGEEISWGQRIVGFDTPGYLTGINDHREFNTHNITVPYIGAMNELYNQLPMIIFTIAIAAFFCGKDRLYGIQMPSLAVILGVIAVTAYADTYWYESRTILFYQMAILLLMLASYAVIKKCVKLLPAIVSAAIIIAGNDYVMWQTYLPIGWPREVAEYLLGVICVWYAFEVLLEQKRFVVLGKKFGDGLKLPAIIDPQRLGIAVFVLAIAAGIGLGLLAHFSSTIRGGYFRANYSAQIADAEQVAGAYFNIFSSDGRLYYFKDNCTRDDIAGRFFLHIYPVQPSNLPAKRQQYGFLNRDFDFRRVGLLSDGQCAASIALPEYPIASAVTGQFKLNGTRLWEVELALRPFADAVFDAPDTDTELLARAHFDIYAAGNNLYYSKENCVAADIDAPFFLHIYPVRTADLSVDQQQYGFQNLDFVFATHGRRTGTECWALVALPPYSITAIHTGQHIPGGPRLWEAEFALPSAP